MNVFGDVTHQRVMAHWSVIELSNLLLSVHAAKTQLVTAAVYEAWRQNKFQLDQKVKTTWFCLFEMKGSTCLNYISITVTQSSIKEATPTVRSWTDSQLCPAAHFILWSITALKDCSHPQRVWIDRFPKQFLLKCPLSGNQFHSEDLAKLLQVWRGSSRVTV